ncbi:hypothetical protein NBRC116599_13990 [Aquicoccus sp. SU-CL01552]
MRHPALKNIARHGLIGIGAAGRIAYDRRDLGHSVTREICNCKLSSGSGSPPQGGVWAGGRKHEAKVKAFHVDLSKTKSPDTL